MRKKNPVRKASTNAISIGKKKVVRIGEDDAELRDVYVAATGIGSMDLFSSHCISEDGFIYRVLRFWISRLFRSIRDYEICRNSSAELPVVAAPDEAECQEHSQS